MDLTHEFTVPASVETTWAAFTDIESVAGCFPGATVTAVEGDAFEGSCKVKLGPIALVYNGAGAITEKDESAHRLVIDAKGKDKRGNGTAGAGVVATLEPVDDTSTRVKVVTDLKITGKPAQFGRGVMQDVSDKLLAQFVDCLAQKLEAPTSAEPEPEEVVGTPAVTGKSAVEPEPARPASQPSTPPVDDALDLGATVLPVLVRSYWKQATGVLVGLWLLRRLLRRR